MKTAPVRGRSNRGGLKAVRGTKFRLPDAVAGNLRATFSPESVETIVSLGEAVAAAPVVWITGVRHGRFLADYLRWSLIHARPNVRTSRSVRNHRGIDHRHPIG